MAINMIMPLLVHRFVVFIEKEDYTQSDLNNAVMMMVFKEFLETAKYFQEKWGQQHISKAGKITTGALKAMIFNKNFRMSSSAKKQYTTA